MSNHRSDLVAYYRPRAQQRRYCQTYYLFQFVLSTQNSPGLDLELVIMIVISQC